MKKLLCIIGIIFATMMSTTAFAEMIYPIFKARL